MAEPEKTGGSKEEDAVLELPEEVLRELGVADGDTVFVSVTDKGLHISTEPTGKPPADKG